MIKPLIYAAALSLFTAFVIPDNYASAKLNNGKVTHVDGNEQFPHTRWQIVRYTFQLHVPKNSNAINQLIIKVPDNIAENDDITNINVFNEKNEKLQTNVSINGRTILLVFPEAVAPNTKFYIDLNNVKRPTIGSNSLYRLSVKVVGSDGEIPIGVAQFHTY